MNSEWGDRASKELAKRISIAIAKARPYQESVEFDFDDHLLERLPGDHLGRRLVTDKIVHDLPCRDQVG